MVSRTKIPTLFCKKYLTKNRLQYYVVPIWKMVGGILWSGIIGHYLCSKQKIFTLMSMKIKLTFIQQRQKPSEYYSISKMGNKRERERETDRPRERKFQAKNRKIFKISIKIRLIQKILQNIHLTAYLNPKQSRAKN